MLTAAIIDDDRDTVAVFSEYLESLNVKVVSVGYNGKDAVEIYKKHRPDILFLDLKMPQYDGIYALKEIRASYPHAKIVIITADLTKEDSEKMSDLKPTEIFYKPFDIDKITDLLDMIGGPPRSYDKTKAALISVTIEQALLKINKTTVLEVGQRLYSKYGCYFSDCLEHPEYLKDILEEIFGAGADAVIKTIKENLAEFEDQQPISKFLSIISS